jgi:hypothetical protein
MDEEQARQVIQICEKLHPFMEKHLINLMEKYGPEVSISVISSIVIRLFAHSITMVEVKGGDLDRYVRIIMQEISHKQGEMSAAVQTQATLDKILTPSGNSTCRPLH